MSNVWYTTDRQSDERPNLTRAEELEHTKPIASEPLANWLAWESNNGVTFFEMSEDEQARLFVAKTLQAINKEHYLLFLSQESNYQGITFSEPTGWHTEIAIDFSKANGYYIDKIERKVISMYGHPVSADSVAKILGAGCAPVTASNNTLRQGIAEHRIAINNAVDDQNFGRKMLEKGKFPRVIEKFLIALQVAGFTINKVK